MVKVRKISNLISGENNDLTNRRKNLNSLLEKLENVEGPKISEILDTQFQSNIHSPEKNELYFHYIINSQVHSILKKKLM